MSPVLHWSLTNFCFFSSGSAWGYWWPRWSRIWRTRGECANLFTWPAPYACKIEQILGPDWLPEPILSAQDCPIWSQRKKFSSLKPVYIFRNFWETFSQKFRNMYFCISAVFTTFKSQTRLEESDNEEIETTRIVLNSFWNLFVWTHLWFLIHGCSKIQIYNSF